MKEDFSTIVSSLRTKEEADRLLSEIDILLNSYFEVSEKKQEEILNKKVSYQTSQLFKNILKSYGTDYDSFKKFLDSLREEIQSLPILKITIAFLPRQATLESLHEWTSKNLKSSALLDLTNDPNILGGAQMSFGGIYKDLSLRKKLDEAFETKKEEIMATLKN